MPQVKSIVCLQFVLLVFINVIGGQYLHADEGNQPNQSVPIYQLKPNFDSVFLGDYFLHYEDLTHQRSFEEIVDLFHQNKFEPLQTKIANLGQFRGDAWFYGQLATSAEISPHTEWIIKLGNPWAELFNLYWREQGGEWQFHYLNGTIPFSERSIDDLHFVHGLKLEPETNYEFFIHSYVAGPAIYPIALMTDKTRLESNATTNYWLGAYYGLMGVMIFYNLFLFLGTRSFSYLHYIIYLSNVLAFILFYDGVGAWMFLPNNPGSGHYALHFFAASTSVAACIFCRSFLQTAERLPRIDLGLRISIWVSLILCVAVFILSIELTAMLLNLTTLVFSTLIICGGVSNWINGYKDTRFFLLGWVLFVLCASVLALMFLGVLPWNDFTRHSVQIGSTLEAVLISLALADRVNIYRENMHQLELEAKAALEKQNEELIRGHQMKDEFLATVSHELRTPMNGIIGSLELMKVTESIDEIRGFVETADRSSDQMMRLIGDVLELSDLRSGHAKPLDATFNLHENIRSVFGAFYDLGKEKGLQMVFESELDPTQFVKADWGKIEMATYHLLDNAVKFTDTGSVSMRVELKGHDLVVRVRDTGVGIDETIKESIFENFKQGDGSFNREYQGLGIGLPLCARAMDVLTGEISFGPNDDKGTEFLLRVPVTLAEQSQVKDFLFDADTEERKVLVAEDNRVNQKVLVGILKKLGCTVLTADNGDEAITLCSQNKFDLIFMDCQMPKVDGYEATRRIRKMNRLNSTTPVIAVTANVMTQDRVNCFQAGMNDFVKKPIRVPDIQKAMSRQIEG